jgi:hypothetical protein
VFGRISALVEQACRECDFRIAILGAKEFGMVGGRDNNSWGLDYDFKLVDSEGAKVLLKFHSYDQSKAFSVRPDMNKFEVTLTVSNGPGRQYQNQYEG